jgi:hypothetical protein
MVDASQQHLSFDRGELRTAFINAAHAHWILFLLEGIVLSRPLTSRSER